MFISLNRKIVYSILSLFLTSIVIFILAFYSSYSTKIEKDQQASILRNQQYTDLLYRNANLIKELKQILSDNPSLKIDKDEHFQIYNLIYETNQTDLLTKDQQILIERVKSFDEQYATINRGVNIILSSAVILALFIVLIGYLISRWVLQPINRISEVSEQISCGNLNLRLPPRKNIKFSDELDKLSSTFNMMLDNLQNMISEIKDKENFLQALIDSIPDGIRVIDENYRIIIANKNYYKQSGDTPKSCKKCYESSFNLNHPCNNQHTPCPLREILHNNKKSINLIHQFSYDHNRYLAVNAAPLVLDDNRKYIIESIRDLSNAIDFSHQQKISSLGFLSSSIAHEIKNHLGALRIIMEHLIDKHFSTLPDDNEQKKMINMIHSELVNAVGVPERLLKLTRNYNNSETKIDCASAINDIVGLLDYEAKSKGVDIIFTSPTKSPKLQGNETDFKIAVINIILNAIKAMPNKGLLKIQLTVSAQKEIKISFKDNGIGIAKSSLPNIFNPYFSDNHQKNSDTTASGSGLGLAITKSIVEKIGGSISVTSVLGKGSCFTMQFPTNKKLAKK